MSFLRGAKTSSKIPEYTGLQIQTSSSSVPIQILWGANRIAPNLIWTGNFRAYPQSTKKKGGKGGLLGGGGGGGGGAGYDYTSGFMLGICEGPIHTVGTVWNGSGMSGLPYLGFSLFMGTTPETTWGYLSSAYPSQALPYGGLAYAANASFYLGATPSLPPLTFEVFGHSSFAASFSSYDADPALIIQDFLTNTQYGVNFPASSISATSLLGPPGGSSYQAYCQAARIALSPVLANQESANIILARWLQLTNSAAVWSSGQLKFIPYGDSVISSETGSFAPNCTPLYDLNDNDFVNDGDTDPVQVHRGDPLSARNWVSLEISNRSNAYAATPVQAWDQNAIELYGMRRAPSIAAREICDLSVAQSVVQLILQRGLHIRNTYSFKLSFEYCLLEPMDLVTVTDTGLGLSEAVVRVLSVEEDAAGLLSVVAEEFPGETSTAAVYPIQDGLGSSLDLYASPGSVSQPIIFEPPAALTSGLPEVWIAVSGGNSGFANQAWGGAYVYASTDNVTFGLIGQLNAPARHGVLSSPLLAGTGVNPDIIGVLGVDMMESGATLNGASEADARNGETLSIVESELLAYATVTMTGAHAYALTYLERGLFGSPSPSHPAGSRFARLDDAIFKYGVPEAYIGAPLFFKFQSFNIFGRATEDISTCATYAYTPNGSGAMGSIVRALLAGTNLDYGLATAVSANMTDYGLASDPYATMIDLGLASA